MNEIISQFEKSKHLRQQLKKHQNAADVNNVKVIMKPCDTRSSSTLRACDRILLLKPWINILIPHSDTFWNHLQMLIKFLLQYQISTDILQSDRASLYDIYQHFIGLQKHAATIPADNFIHPVRLSVASILSLRTGPSMLITLPLLLPQSFL